MLLYHGAYSIYSVHSPKRCHGAAVVSILTLKFIMYYATIAKMNNFVLIGNPWNSENCYEISSLLYNKSRLEMSNSSVTNSMNNSNSSSLISSSEEFFL